MSSRVKELSINTSGNYKFKVNNRNFRTSCEIWSKLTIKTSEWRHWRRSGVFIVNFEHISHLVLVFPLLTLSRQMPADLFSVSKLSESVACYTCMGLMREEVLSGLVPLWALPTSPWLIPYRLDSENWYIASSSLTMLAIWILYPSPLLSYLPYINSDVNMNLYFISVYLKLNSIVNSAWQPNSHVRSNYSPRILQYSEWR